MNNRKIWFYSLLSFFLLTTIWEASVYLSGWSKQVFPGPLHVVSGFAELVGNGELLKHAVDSLYRVTLGFYIAVVIGVPLGVFIGRNVAARHLINPLIQFMRPISPLAWIPLAMLWFGIGDQPAVFLIFLSCFFPLVVSTAVAVESINPIYFQVAANFNFSTLETIKKVIVPAIIPDVVTALRLTVGIAWLVVVAAEMIAVQSGLGYLILDSRNALRMDYVMVAMISIGVIGLCLDIAMRRIMKLDCAIWGRAMR